MTHPERVDQYLEHISQAIERINRYLIPLGSIEIFLANEQIQDAIIRNIEIIGEAANRIQNASPQFVIDHPDLPWTEMRGMRNKMIHEYFSVDLQVVWATITQDLPKLKLQVDKLISEQ